MGVDVGEIRRDRAPVATLQRAVRRAVAPIRGHRGRVEDPNFIGFDKYRRNGAYHWIELDESDEYRGKIDLVGRYATPTDRCLDVGCGDGAYAFALSRHVTHVVGIDADYDAVRLANRELRRRSVANVRCQQRAISDLTLAAVHEAEPFDLVYSMDVIEHLPQPEQLLERAVSVVAPTGTVVVGTPLFLGNALLSPYHVREFRRDELVELVEPWLDLSDVHVLPMRRLDGAVHDEGFVVAVGQPR
jgi:2-polyprenyl-3-methyl-5-hydroxy-6-metoxy-1,4-benzoquinol methylase